MYKDLRKFCWNDEELSEIVDNKSLYIYYENGTLWPDKCIISDDNNPSNSKVEVSDLIDVTEWLYYETDYSYKMTPYDYNNLLNDYTDEEMREEFIPLNGGEIYTNNISHTKIKDSILSQLIKSNNKNNLTYNKARHLLELEDYEEINETVNKFHYILTYENRTGSKIFLINLLEYDTNYIYFTNNEDIDVSKLIYLIKEIPEDLQYEGILFEIK